MAYKFWRILIKENGGTTFTAIAELRFLNNGSIVSVGGTAFTDSVYNSSFGASRAFDSDPATNWLSESGNGFPIGIGYEFPSPTEITDLEIVSVNTATRAPTLFEVQYSRDGISWLTTPDGEISSAGWTGGETRSFAVATPAVTLITNLDSSRRQEILVLNEDRTVDGSATIDVGTSDLAYPLPPSSDGLIEFYAFDTDEARSVLKTIQIDPADIGALEFAKIFGATTSKAQASKVSGIVQIDGTPGQRTVRAFGYNPTVHQIDGENINLSKSLGHATSDPDTGEYTIDLLAGYDKRIFVVAFDDYGVDFTPDLALAVGDRVHPTTPNGHVFECTGAGTLPSEEPAWVVDTETAQLYGTASMIARLFYRPMVHGPVVPEVTEYVPPTLVFRESITAGSNFTLAINKDGIIDGWGKDESLILSDIPPTSDAIEVVAGHNHALALLSDGSVVGWGNNTNNKSTPPADLGPCKKIAAGPEISAAIREDGSVVIWGDSGYNVQVVPAEVVDPIDIACAYRTVVALLPDGSLVVWGQDYDGLVSGAPDITDGIQVVGGRYTLAVLRAGGVVNEWGTNYGAPSSPDPGIRFIAGGGYSFGAPKADQSILTWGNTGAPGQALDIERLAFGSFDSSHGAAILADGSVFCWGDNDNGQCDAPAGFIGLQPQNPERFS